MKRFGKISIVIGMLACAIAVGVVSASGAARENIDFRDMKVLNKAKIKSLELGGDPKTGEAGTAITAPASAGNGAVAGSGVTVAEYNTGMVHKTVITFTDRAVALTDVAATVAYGGSKIYDLPEGAILILGATSNIALTKSSAGVNADWDGDFGIGTVTASNNASLSSTEQNIIPTTATPQAVSGATTANGQSTATENAVINGTATAADVYFNLLVDDADQDVTGTACNLILNGTVTLIWLNLGDY